MWESLQHLDVDIFRWINMSLSNAFFDAVLPLWRNKFFWIPLYIFFIALILQQYRKKSWIIFIAFAALIGLSDFTSSQLIKKNIKRLRPCQDELLSRYSNTLVHCGSGYSMTSSHATNHMAIAVFLFLAIGQRRKLKLLKWPLIIWATTIGFAQVYVGVHYPGDVFFGFIVGAIIGCAVAAATLRCLKLLTTSDAQPVA